MQFVYGQTVDNEIVENPSERVGNATTNSNISETLESLNHASESTTDSTTITSDISKQHNQSEFKIYENQNIGVKFKMPSTWWILFEFNNTKNCFDVKVDKIFIFGYEDCGIVLWNKKFGEGGVDFTVTIIKRSPANYSLADFLTRQYEYDKKHVEGFSFINDKQMTIQNNSAWQIEFSIRSNPWDPNYPWDLKRMYMVTKINNTFYYLSYYPTNVSEYSKYLPEVENFIKSIEFIPSIEPIEIEPKSSFLKHSTLKNTINNSETIEQNQASKRFVEIEQVENTVNWTIGESDKFSFIYPSHWNVNVSDSRFDNYELIFTDKASDASIQVSEEAIQPRDKMFKVESETSLEFYKRYVDFYMKNKLPLSSNASKIETYPEGKVSIAERPAYSELYLDQGYAVLVSLAFPEGDDRHYTVVSNSPSSNYDKLEPIMLDIIKSIMPKTIQKQSDQEIEIPSNNTDFGNNKDAAEELQTVTEGAKYIGKNLTEGAKGLAEIISKGLKDLEK